MSTNEESLAPTMFGCLFISLILLLCGGCVTGCASGGFNYSDGYRDGQIRKLSHKGVLWKTYEGELVLQGLRTGENSTIQLDIFNFSVTDPKVVEQIQNIKNGQRVRLYYHKYILSPSWKGETSYRIIDVEILQ